MVLRLPFHSMMVVMVRVLLLMLLLLLLLSILMERRHTVVWTVPRISCRCRRRRFVHGQRGCRRCRTDQNQRTVLALLAVPTMFTNSLRAIHT